MPEYMSMDAFTMSSLECAPQMIEEEEDEWNQYNWGDQ